MKIKLVKTITRVGIKQEITRTIRVLPFSVPPGISQGAFTDNGDILVGTGAGTFSALPTTGAAGRLLMEDPTSPLKVKWGAPPSNTQIPLMLKVIEDATALTTGDGKYVFPVPAHLNGLSLISAHAAVAVVSSSGTPTVMLHNLTDGVDMLTTGITIDINEKTSYTAATPAAIDAAHDDVATGDILRVDVDVAGTGAKGLTIILVFA